MFNRDPFFSQEPPIGSGKARRMARLYYGDNLEVMAKFPDASIDLIYLDPPFNSNAAYNMVFKGADGIAADASIHAFDDTWSWGDASRHALADIERGVNSPLKAMIGAMHRALGDGPLMAYLAMMAVRLQEMHRILKDSGSLYLHCDPTASHYLKLVLDATFGAENFRNEIIWRRTNAHNKLSRQFGPIHDTILFYSRSAEAVFHPGRRPFTKRYVEESFPYEDERGRYQSNVLTGAGTRKGESGQAWREYEPAAKGRHWAIPRNLLLELAESDRSGSSQDLLDRLDAAGLILHPAKAGSLPRYKQYLHRSDGVLFQDIWAFQPGTRGVLAGTDDGIDQDVKWLDGNEEKIGYPTQKPRGLLERIIAASSNPGDLVLDPFCGCGTAVDAAQKLGRRWIGIDITHIAIGMIENRMREAYPGVDFETFGSPKDLDSAKHLATKDPYQFQQWVSWQAGGYPRDKKGGDKGVDGWFNYLSTDGTTKQGVISVKAGECVNPAMVRDLGRVMHRDGFRFGLLITRAEPTKGMREEAASHPLIETEFGRFPALQIITVAELMDGRRPRLPPLMSPFKRTTRVETRTSHQTGSQGSLFA